MTAFAGRKSDIYVTAGVPVAIPATDPMTDLTASGFAARTTYGITAAARRYFDPNTALVVQQSLDSGATWNTVVPDVVAVGYVQFIVPRQLAPLAQLRVLSGNYLPYSRMGGGFEWTFSPVMDIFDVTEFGMTSHKHIASLAGGTIALKRWWLDDSMRSVIGNKMVVVLYTDASAQPVGSRYEAFAILKADAIKVAVSAAVDEALNLDIQSDVAYLAA